MSLILLIPCLMKGNIIKVIAGVTSSHYDYASVKSTSGLTFAGGIGIETSQKMKRLEVDVVCSYEKANLGNNSNYSLLKFSMPLLFKYKFKQLNFPYVIAGGAASVTFAIEDEIHGIPLKDRSTTALFDVSAIIGAGMEINLKSKGRHKGAFMLEGRYQFGLMEMKLNDLALKTNAFYIVIGIKFK